MIRHRYAEMKKAIWRGIASVGLFFLGMLGLSGQQAEARQSLADSPQAGSRTNAQTQIAQCHCNAIYGVRG